MSDKQKQSAPATTAASSATRGPAPAEIAQEQRSKQAAPRISRPASASRLTSLQHNDILALQRTIGNRAVNRLLARNAEPPTKKAANQPMTPSLQRKSAAIIQRAFFYETEQGKILHHDGPEAPPSGWKFYEHTEYGRVYYPPPRYQYDQLSVGQYYKVRVTPNIIQTLYLQTRRKGKDGLPSEYTFYPHQYDRSQNITIYGERQILEATHPPPVSVDDDPTTTMQVEDEASQVATQGAPEKPDLELGIVSWNVAHFSKKDLDALMNKFQEQFQQFSKEDWGELFDHVDRFILKINKSIEQFKVESNEEEEADKEQPKSRRTSGGIELREIKKRKTENVFKGDRDLRKEHQGIFKQLKGNVDHKLVTISDLISKLQQAKGSFNTKQLIKEIEKVSSIDWQKEWEESKVNKAKRAILADKIKQLRKFEELSEPAKKLIEATQNILGNTELQTLLGRLRPTEHGALLYSLSQVSNALPKVQTIYELGRALHSQNIIIHLHEMFKNNEWLDLVILQEVNNPEALEENQDQYTVHRGPHLLSGGSNPQHEFYPLLTRKGSDIKVIAQYQVPTSGNALIPVAHNEPINWNKDQGIYRPIIVYEIEKGRGASKQKVYIGVVHTTPEQDSGISEFNRIKIYKEVDKGLRQLQNIATSQNIPLIVGGDYYLTAEAVIKDLPGGYRQALEGKNKTIKNMENIKIFADKLITILTQELLQLPQPGYRTEEQEQQAKLLNERIKFLTEAQKDSQILRNYFKLTVQKNVEAMGLFVAQTISGTNPKADPLTRWFDLQIADFFIHNGQWRTVKIGVVRPEGQLATTDTDDLQHSKYWQHFSDHFPVGGIFSINPKDLSKHPAFAQHPDASRASRELNIVRFAYLYLGAKSIDDLKKFSIQELEIYALQYLQDYMSEEFGDSEVFASIEEYIERIQELQLAHKTPEDLKLLAIGSEDIEPETIFSVKDIHQMIATQPGSAAQKGRFLQMRLLQHLSARQAVRLLIDAFRDQDDDAIAYALELFGNQAVFPLIHFLRELASEQSEKIIDIAGVLSQIPGAFPHLIPLLKDNNAVVRRWVAWSLGTMRFLPALTPLWERQQIEPDETVREQITKSIQVIRQEWQ